MHDIRVLILDDESSAMQILDLLRRSPVPPSVRLSPSCANSVEAASIALPDADLVVVDISSTENERFAQKAFIGRKPVLLMSVSDLHCGMTEYPELKFCPKNPLDEGAFQAKMVELVAAVSDKILASGSLRKAVSHFAI